MFLFPDANICLTKYFDVHQDREVPIVGFVIIASKRDIRSIDEMGDEELEEFMKLLRKLRQHMREKLGIEEVYLFQNEDSKHHFHCWIFPRHPWMESFGRRIQSVRPIMEYAQAHFADTRHCEEVLEAIKILRDAL